VDAIEAIKQRRSVKHYDPNYQMSGEEIKRLISLARMSPTAFNMQNVRFVIVHDKELRQKIRAVSWNQRQVTDASLLIILCADLKAWEKDPIRYLKDAPKKVQDNLLRAMDQYYRNNELAQRDEAMRSCGIVAQTIMLAAKAMGYDTCPMDGFEFDKVAKLINLPEDHVISMFVVVGKALNPARDRPGQLSSSDVVIHDHF
jgi:nitroreductase